MLVRVLERMLMLVLVLVLARVLALALVRVLVLALVRVLVLVPMRGRRFGRGLQIAQQATLRLNRPMAICITKALSNRRPKRPLRSVVRSLMHFVNFQPHQAPQKARQRHHWISPSVSMRANQHL